MPAVLGTTEKTIPANVPYLAADPERVAFWRARLPADGFKVGIVWQGRPDAKIDKGRSVPLRACAPIAAVPGVRLISLQKSHGLDQLAGLPEGLRVETLGPDFDAGPDAFRDAAAAMMSLDLVITSDTSIAHLAGALGRPVWIVLKSNPDWRWLIGREDSPWYPTARLFRQRRRGDWDELFERVAKEVARIVSGEREEAVPGNLEPMPMDEPALVPVAVGELADKITILEIKAERITDAAKLRNVRSELNQLRTVWDRRGARPAAVDALTRELKKINESLWAIEDDIRECERQRNFGSQFVELARAVYRTNDRRAEIKREINLSAGSNIIEEKSYRDYQSEAVEPPGDAAQVSAPRGTASQQGSVTVLKDCRHGRMLFLKRDQYIGRSLDIYGEFSELEAQVFTQLLRADDVVVEAGANIGAHTVHIAKTVGAHGLVLAFEPQRAIHELLCANIALNEFFHVRSYHAALGRDLGTIKVPVLDYGSEGNFGGLSLSESSAGEDVPLFALDSFALPALRMLKVDVEGMEAEVLSGARETIGRLRPILYVENDRRAQSEQLIKLIDELGYDMWWHLPPLFSPGNFAQARQNIFGGTVSNNLLCLPKEKPTKVSGLRPVTGPKDWERKPSTQTPEIIFGEAPPLTKPTT